MGSGDKTPDFITSGWQGVDNPATWDFSDSVGLYNDYGSSHLADPAAVVDTTSSTNTSASAQTQKQKPAKKSVTIDVSKLIDELIKTGICLGRAPGFRKKDVDRALSSAIIQVF